MTDAPENMAERAEVAFTYVNYRGEISERVARPISLAFRATEYHPDPQWILRAFDVHKGAERDFALRDCQFRADLKPRVKPLVWGVEDDLPSVHDTIGCGVLYRVIKRHDGSASLRINNMNREHSSHASVEAAKAAAQADLERRILAALDMGDTNG